MLKLVLSLMCLAAPQNQVVWEHRYKNEAPQAVYFDAVSSSIYVSLNEGNSARLDKFDTEGKFVETVAHEVGEAGALRSYDGAIFWIVGNDIFKVKNSAKKILSFLAKPNDLAIDPQGKIYVALKNGEIWKEEVKINSGEEVKGLLYLDDLYFIRKEKIQSLSGKKIPFCDCTGLERASNQSWLAARGNTVQMIEKNKMKKLLEAGGEMGRISYVYRMNDKEDFLVLPLPKLKQVRAIRVR